MGIQSEYLVQVTGEKKEKYMKNRTKKTSQSQLLDGTFGKLQIIDDFLPSPEELLKKTPPTKVSINLDAETVEYFKSQAQELGGSYQRMIRVLLQHYVNTMKSRQ